MTKVIVVGAGASGLAAAIVAARRGNNVLILEKNESVAKKLLMTGNGRCNYWNIDQDCKHYHSSSCYDIRRWITKENQEKVMEFFSSLGVVPKIKNGYYYPYSMQAVSMKAVLLNEIESLRIPIITNSWVIKIEKKENQFFLYTQDKKYTCDAVIYAVGSKAGVNKTEEINGYSLLESLGHTIIPVLPSLTQVYGSDTYYKEWSGLRLDARLTLYIDEEFKNEETGELQLTDYGLSGICTFNLSGIIAKALFQHKKVKIRINFLPDMGFKSENDLISWLEEREAMLINRNITQLFDGFLPYKLVYLFLHLCNIPTHTFFKELNSYKKEEFVSFILNHTVNVFKTNDFLKAQVCSGGVSLEEMDCNTMESLKVKNLYCTGEVMDIDGDCGGYNLGFAWLSGIVAGSSVGDNHD